jgi:hypothetical protein
MKVEQAVFTSTSNSVNQGYQLVARSPAIGEAIAQQLCRWGPSHGSLLNESQTAESLNFHLLGKDLCALSRSVLGGPEYSHRGGLQVVTRTLIFHTSLLASFDYNPSWILRTALALGYLRLYCGSDAKLPSISFPDASRIGCFTRRSPSASGNEGAVSEACQMLLLGRSVAITGATDAQATLYRILSFVPPAERARMSFTTGLRPCVHRPFRLHVLSHASPDLSFQLAKLGISQVVMSAQN